MTVQEDFAIASQAMHDLVCPATRRLDRTSDAGLERLLVDGLDAAESHFREAIAQEDETEQTRAVALHAAVRGIARYRWGEKAGSPEEIRLRHKTRATRIASRERTPAPVADILAPELPPPTARALALKAERTNRELGERQAQVEAQARRELDRERARREWAEREAERRSERSRWSRLGGLMGGGR